jgi:hypothetical protein
LDERRAAPAPTGFGTLRERLVDAAFVVAVWAGCLVAENTALALLWPQQFSGVWEIALARYSVLPIAILGLAPASLVVVGLWQLARAAATKPWAAGRWVLGGLGGLAWGALALGISNGRHFASWAVRGPFVLLLGLLGALLGALVVPRLTGLSKWPLVLASRSRLEPGWLTDTSFRVSIRPFTGASSF